jgi:hypothetical protein
MSDSRFWRLIAVLFVAGVFYVGHGLHNGGEIPALDSPAIAGAPWGNPNDSRFFTVSEDGRTLYVWRNSGAQVKAEGKVESPFRNVEKQKQTE